MKDCLIACNVCRVLKGHGFSRAISDAKQRGFSRWGMDMMYIDTKFLKRLRQASRWFVLVLLACLAGGFAQAQTLSFSPGQVTAVTATDSTKGSADPAYTGLPSGLKLTNPQGLTFDSKGNLFIVDAGANVVRVVASGNGKIPSLPSVASPKAGTVYTVAGNGSRTPSTTQLCTADQRSSIDNSFYGNGCPAGKAILFFLTPNDSNPDCPLCQFTAPIGQVALDASGNLYIADGGDNQVRVVYAGGSVPPGLTGPLTAGNIYAFAGSVANQNTGDQSPDGSTNLPPIGVAVDASGDVYILSFFTGAADYGMSNLAVVYNGGTNASTLPSLLAGQTLTTGQYAILFPLNYPQQDWASLWRSPASIALDSSGNIYISDSNYGNNSVYVIYAGGTVPGLSETLGGVAPVVGNAYKFAGGTQTPSYPPGAPATEVATWNPTQLSIDPAGDLYMGLHRGYFGGNYYEYLAKVDTSGNLALFAGSLNFNTDGIQAVCAAAVDGYGDGCTADQTAIYGPMGVAVAPDGSIYYADAYVGSNASTYLYALHKIDASTKGLQFSAYAGVAASAQVVTVSNVGAKALNFSAIDVPSPFVQAASGGTDCSASTSLAPGQSCLVAVQLSASPVGAYSGNLLIASNSTNATSGSNAIALAGSVNTAPNSTTLTASTDLANVGQPVTLTATIKTSFTDNVAATGTVNFLNGATSVGSATVSKNTATLVTSTLPAGTYALTASYSGDSNYSASTSSPLTLVVSSKPVPVVTLATSASSINQGQAVTFTATVSQFSGTTRPTGSVTFTDGTNALGSASLNGSGVATFSTTALPVGENTIYAVYGGDSNFPANTSEGSSITVLGNALLAFQPTSYFAVAGNGTQGPTGDGGSATSAALDSPSTQSVDPFGNVYIADGSTVRVVASGKGVIPGIAKPTANFIYTVAGGGYCTKTNGILNCGDGGPATSAGFGGGLNGVWADYFGNVYISDTGNNLVRKVNSSGIISTVAGNLNTSISGLGDGGQATSATLQNPGGIRTDINGNLYIADEWNCLIRRVDAKTGIMTTVAGDLTLNCTQLSDPKDVALDESGNLFIADNGAGVVHRVDAETGVMTTVAGNGSNGYSGDGGPATSAALYGPSWVSVDPIGDIYISDVANKVVRRVDALTGYISTAVTSNGNRLGGIALDSQGNLFVTDKGKYIQELSLAGPAAMDFGAQQLGSTSTKTNTVSNAGTQPLSITAINFPSGFTQAASGGTDCTATTTLTSGQSCELTIEFFPTSGSAAGTPYSGDVTINSNSANAISGVNSITVSGVAKANSGTTPQSITLNPAPPSTATYGQKITLNATASSGLPVTILASGPATLIGNNLTVTGVGTITVTAYQFGDNGDANNASGWAAATPVKATINAQAASLTVTADSFSRAPGLSNPALTYTMSGLVNGDTAASVTKGAPALSTTATEASPTGSYDITITQNTLVTTTPNYTLSAASFVKGTLTITAGLSQTITFPAIPNANSLVYGASPITLTATTSAPGLQVVYTVTGPARITGSILSITGAGPVAVTATQPGDATYQAAQTVTQSFIVASAPLTFSANNLTMAAESVVPALTYTVSGLANGDTAANVVSGTPVLTTTATSSSPVNTYPITIAQGSATLSSTNYTLTSASFVSGTMNVVAGSPQTINFVALPNVTYGATSFALSATAGSGLPVTFTVSSGPASLTSNLLSVTGAGTVTVTATQGGNATYTAATPVPQSFTVEQAPLTIAANNLTRVDNIANPALTYTISGFVNGDTASTAVTGTAALATTATPASLPGKYPITWDTSSIFNNISSSNYSFSNFVPGTLTITSGGPAQNFAMTLSQPSLTILAGSTGQVTITIAPTNYYQGVLNLSCTGLPANASCIFTPAALPVTLNYASSSSTTPIPTTGTLSITTSSAPVVGALAHSGNGIFSAAIGGWVSLLFGIVFVWQRKRLARYRTIWVLAMAACLFGMTASLTACGSTSTSFSLTKPGTSTIQVVATDSNGGPVNSTALTITIQ
jgi:sugar lactone lactonase YvrE